MARIEISGIVSDWDVKRDRAKDTMELPLLTYEEWYLISRITDMNWRNWMDLVMGGNGVMSKR